MQVLRTALVAALLSTSALAQAGQYAFSYDFGSGAKVTGSFWGKQIGDVITDWSNVSLSVNGQAFPSDLYAAANGGGFPKATASFDGLKNYFYIYAGSSFDYYFAARAVNNGATDYIAIGSPLGQAADGVSQVHDYDTARWSLKEIPLAVPEPATYAMMFGGLALIGAIARRRKAL